MNISYDSEYNIAYIALRDKPGKNVETIRLSDEVNIDISSDGSIYGIELLNAKKQLKAKKKELSFSVSDGGSKRNVHVPLGE